MNIGQAVKMAWRSIWGKKGRSMLTILSIFIGIAAVMTIVSVMEGMKEYTRRQYAAMGTNKISVSIYNWSYDENGNYTGKDYFRDIYDFCNSMPEYVVGVTPNGYAGATVSYGTKSTANMEWEYDEMGNFISGPPSMYYGSDQYSVCNNLEISKGRDLAYLDVTDYKQVCIIGAFAAKTFFGSANPVGEVMSVNGQKFTVVGVYAPRVEDDNGQPTATDNFIVFPYTARRILGGEPITEYTVKAKDSDSITEAVSRISGFLKGIVDSNSGGYSVYSDSSWQESENEIITMISLVLGGIAAISLLVGGIGIMNIMLVTVTERTREIGVRRAIGARRSSIVIQFLIEAAMLCGMGGLLGMAVGTVGSVILSKLIIKITIYPSLWVTLAAFSLSVVLGLLFGSYPAAKASRLQPVDALRAE